MEYCFKSEGETSKKKTVDFQNRKTNKIDKCTHESLLDPFVAIPKETILNVYLLYFQSYTLNPTAYTFLIIIRLLFGIVVIFPHHSFLTSSHLFIIQPQFHQHLIHIINQSNTFQTNNNFILK